jgi:hypothetical protein
MAADTHTVRLIGNVLEVLPDPLPLTATRFEALGIRGVHGGSGLNLLPGWLNTDLLRPGCHRELCPRRGGRM